VYFSDEMQKRDPFLHGSPVLLIVTHADSDSCALYLMDCSAWPIFRQLLGCSISCLREHQVVIVFEPAAPGHSPDQFRLRWLRSIMAYRRICQVLCALPGRPLQLACQPLCCSSSPVRWLWTAVRSGVTQSLRSAQSSTVGIW